MFGKFFIFLLACNFVTNAETNNNDYSLVFVYLGDKLPAYVNYSIAQARMFNKNARIFFLISNDTVANQNRALINELQKYNVDIVTCDLLAKSASHQDFDQICAKKGIHGYWKFTTERFFYIDELMRDYDLHNVFQVECDVMVYVNLQNYISLLNRYNIKIASPFQNDYLASVSFVYFYNSEAIQKFVEFIAEKQKGQLLEIDMRLLAAYKNYIDTNVYTNYIPIANVHHLPTVPNDFLRYTILKNQLGDVACQPWKYWNHIEEWDSIFDNDGIGSFLNDGNWRFNQAYFDPTLYKFTWERDSENRLIPYIIAEKSKLKYRINTLHIAYKNLDKYISTR